MTSPGRVHRRELPPRRLPRHGDRYERARSSSPRPRSCGTAGTRRDRGRPGDGRLRPRPGARHVRAPGRSSTSAAASTLPPSPQGYPVHIQAGDSDEGREFAARTADVIFCRHGDLEDGPGVLRRREGPAGPLRPRARRAEDHARRRRSCSATPTPRPRRTAAHVRRQQVCPQTAIAFLEQVWGRDLSAYDPDGPLPDVDPDRRLDDHPWPRPARKDPLAVARSWRELAEAKGAVDPRADHRDATPPVLRRHPEHGRRRRSTHVQEDAADGFILVPHLTPGGLDEFVDEVIPELQDRGCSARPTPARRCATTWA